MSPSYHIFRTWALETTAIILAIGLIIAIAATLASYNGEPVPDWGVNLNLNALLALLSTFLRALLVVIVAQVISQRKWDWYDVKRARPLSDLQQFDSGSRGSLGALLLIPTVIRKDFVALAAAIVLLTSFLVGPFVQQANRTVACTFPTIGVDASVPFAHWVPRKDGYRLGIGAPYGSPTPDTVVAILSSVTSPDGVENQISTNCATGYCTFNDGPMNSSGKDSPTGASETTHSTVGMCSKCTNVVSLVTQTHNNTTKVTQRFLPNGFNTTEESYTAAIIRPAADLTWMGDLFTPEIRETSRWAYVNATFLAGMKDNVAASVCSLYPCLRTYTASITNNQLLEEEDSSEVMQIEYDGRSTESFEDVKSYNTRTNIHYNYTAIKSPCRVAGREFQAPQSPSTDSATTNLALYDFTNEQTTSRNISVPEHCIYRHDPEFVRAIAQILEEEVFDGFCTTWKGLSCTKRDQESYSGEMTTLGAGTALRTLYDNGNMTYPNISRYFDAFAHSMTNRFRFEYGSARKPKNTTDVPSLDVVQGVAWQTKVCVSMRWEWLLLPICLTACTTILSVWTIVTNWRHRHTRPVWKDSIMPLIFYGYKIESQNPSALPKQHFGDPTHGHQEEAGGLMEASRMDTLGRQIPVKFLWPDRKAVYVDDGDAFTSGSSLQQENMPLHRHDAPDMQSVRLDEREGDSEETRT